MNLRHWCIIDGTFVSAACSVEHPAMPVQHKKVRYAQRMAKDKVYLILDKTSDLKRLLKTSHGFGNSDFLTLNDLFHFNYLGNKYETVISKSNKLRKLNEK